MVYPLFLISKLIFYAFFTNKSLNIPSFRTKLWNLSLWIIAFMLQFLLASSDKVKVRCTSRGMTVP